MSLTGMISNKISKKTAIFVREGLLNIREVGTVVPLGNFVAQSIASRISRSSPKTVVELGVGVGSLTEKILKVIGKGDFFIGVDSNKEFIKACRLRFGEREGTVMEEGLAQNIVEILRGHRAGPADEIVSSLPFRAFSKETTLAILDGVKTALKPGGHFTFVRYSIFPKTKEVFESLDDFDVVWRKTVWLNVPPTEIIRVRKPASRGETSILEAAVLE